MKTYEYVVVCINGGQEIRTTFPSQAKAESFNKTRYGGDAMVKRVEVAALLRPAPAAETRNNQNPLHRELAMLYHQVGR